MSTIDKFLGFLTLGEDINKVDPAKLEMAEGVVSSPSPILNVQTSDDDLIIQKQRWIKNWEPHVTKLRPKQDDAENYWLGKQGQDFLTNMGDLAFAHPLTDNIIFEALETFLPQATRKSPEPVLSSDNTKEGNLLADNVRKMLLHLSDILNFKLKLKTVVRNWALYYLGVQKIGWDIENDEISLTSLRPQKLIMDPNATISENGKYTGRYLGEYKKDNAEDLAVKFPEKKDFIEGFVNKQMGTELQYIEWWAEGGRLLFWTLRDEVLGKALNPHFNYEGREEVKTDEFGAETVESFTAANHFKNPEFPYVFLSVFNLGLHPNDDTSLIEQNLGNQDLITKRYRQIDENVDGMNGGWAISGELSGITQEQSASVIRAFREGRGVWIPQGSVQEAVSPMKQPGLPADVFNSLQDGRNELRGIFGTAGSTPAGTAEEKTVRGKIIIGQQDQSRIGGGVAEYLEQFSDTVYNYMVQMMYVYYDEPHIASIIGSENTFETVQIRNTDLNRKLTVSVKEGSMIPKDPLTVANQAIDLFAAGAIDPITLHERLDDPNPRETVKKLVEFQTNPQGLFPEVSQQQPGAAVQGGAEQQSGDLLSSVPLQ